MTNEEATEILKNAAWLGSNKDREKTEEAVNMAIEALRSATDINVATKEPEIIHCRDCKYWEGECINGFWYFEECSLHQCTASENDYCSYAEVKNVENN